MKNLKLLAFMALVGIGQTMICSEEYKERRDAYEQKLAKQIGKAMEDRAFTPSGLLAHIFSSKRQEVASAAYSDMCNIYHQEEFEHCPNTIFTKLRPTPECEVVREFIAATLKYNPQMPDSLERYTKSRERFYAARKATNQ